VAQTKVATQEPKIIELTLQGGGAHGAFTWGVLDRILEDGRIRIEGLSGTSAGAMNGAVVAHGIVRGGYDAAREALEPLFKAVEIDGEAYWDGSFMGNPALFPLIDECDARDGAACGPDSGGTADTGCLHSNLHAKHG
jgi:predicted acylesterase/phospholipase RssA